MRVDAFWILGVIGIWILGVVAAALSRLLAEECKAWVPCFTKWLIRLAIAGLPEDQRERYKEEWQSHIDEIPGDICKIVIAVGFVPASKMMSSEMANKRPRIVNAECHIGARVELRGAAIVRANSRGVLTVGIGTSMRASATVLRECANCGKSGFIRVYQNVVFCDFGSQGCRFEPCQVQNKCQSR
jgi:hypothetical protein